MRKELGSDTGVHGVWKKQYHSLERAAGEAGAQVKPDFRQKTE